MLISYNWLKSYIPDLPKEEELADLLTFKLCEIESVEKVANGDTVFDLNILPDRAHDLLSHRGVAYEIASMLGLKVKENSVNDSFSQSKTNLQIEIQTPNCIRYMGRIVRNVKVSDSPEWMVKYLESIGQRSINNIVDATNIVLFGLGQPIHTFDLNKLSDEKIVVKNAKDNDELDLVGRESLKAKLNNTDMMITDGINNLAVAGVKGGLDSGISNETKDILIEVANFDSVSVRKTARRLGIQTDASKRYENGISPVLCDLAMKEISSLIISMCESASFEEVVDIYNKIPEIKKVSFSSEYISKVLGVTILDQEIEKILKNYHYEFSLNEGVWEVVVPAMRLDITDSHDMVEEIGRVYGYDKVVPRIPQITEKHSDNIIWSKISWAKNKLIKDGYREVMTSVFTNKGELEILASASDKNFLRTNISDGLKKSYELNRLNSPLFDVGEVKIFEVGTIFKKDAEFIHVAFCDKKNVTELSLDEFIEKNQEEFDRDNSSSIILPKSHFESFKMWSLYPFIYRDIAVWIPKGIDQLELISIYKEFGGNLLIQDPKLFDSFTKDERTSYAYRLIFQSYEKTLTDDEVNKVMDKINSKISSLGWEVR